MATEAPHASVAQRHPPAILLAAQFLFPLSSLTAAGSMRPGWRHAARWLTFWGLLIGVGYAALYRGSWKWFGEYQKLRLLPPVILLAADLGWCGYRQITALAQLSLRRPAADPNVPPAVRLTLVLMLLVLLKFALLLSIPIGARPYPADWRERLGPFYPSVIYRPLILMPLWGRWGILLALRIGRVSPGAPERLKAMAGGLRLSEVIVHWFVIALLTVGYVGPTALYLAHGVVIALAVLVLTYLMNFVLTRQAGGQDETTLWATGLMAELAFLILYLPIARAIYSY